MHETPSDGPPRLRCPDCSREYAADPDEPWRCVCGAPLEFASTPRPDGGPPALGDLDVRRGLWAFDAFLPVERRATLGEGFTPLVEALEWDAAFKLEYVLPTGSFKDRGATALLSRAVGLGVERVVEDSSGNAGAAVALYAARAGVDATVYAPADAAESKLAAIEGTGADVVRVEGSRADVTDACVEAVEDGDAWYASHAWNPAFYAGTATFAFEVAAQRDWSVPDAVVLPVGHGTLYLGAYRGFRALSEAGWTDGVPRLLGAQATGYAPLADGLHGASDGERNDVAKGIQITAPARETELREAVAETDGDVVALGADRVRSERERLHRRGFDVEPTAAVAPAALRAYRERGVVDEGTDAVVPLTGTGLKGR